MAKEIIQAIKDGKVLCLRCPIKSSRKGNRYCAIFVSKTSEDETYKDDTFGNHIFEDNTTADINPESLMFSSQGTKEYDTWPLRDIESYVSDLDGITED